MPKNSMISLFPHAMIACQRLRLPPKAAEMLTKVLHETRYLLKTGHGNATKTYSTTLLYQILGVGQGSGSAPSIWTAILDVILWSGIEKYDSFIIKTPTQQIINRLGDAFVDNTAQITTPDLSQNSQHSKHIRSIICHLIQKATTIAQDFEKKTKLNRRQTIPDQMFLVSYHLGMDTIRQSQYGTNKQITRNN